MGGTEPLSDLLMKTSVRTEREWEEREKEKVVKLYKARFRLVNHICRYRTD